MEAAIYINNSLLVTQHPLNVSVEDKTAYEICQHMPEGIVFYLSLQCINMFLGTPSNVMVLWLIHKIKGDSSTSDIFIVHLAVLDIFFCLLPPLELANLMFVTTSIIGYILRFFYAVKDSSSLFLSCICLDRYMAVRHPITFTRLKDRQHRKFCAYIMWLITLVYSVLKCLGTIPNFDKVFTFMILLAFSFMVFCNISILLALKQSGPGRDEMHPVKKRAFKMVLIILAIIVFNYLPPIALFPFQAYFSPEVFKCYINYIAFGFMDISSSIQPMLYLSKLPPACCCKCGITKETDSTNTAEPSTAYSVTGFSAMETTIYILFTTHHPLSVSVEGKTVYETCQHMARVLIFYLELELINTFLGTPSNVMVLWLIHKDSSTSDIFVVHLALLDTFFCLIPPLELASLVYLNTSSTWYILRFFYAIKDCSLLFFSCICLDRYMAVRNPITFTRLKDRHHHKVCAYIMWLITLVYSVLKCLGTIPNFSKVFTVMILLAFSFMVFCNISILLALKQPGPGWDEMHPDKKRAFKMVLIILAIIVFNYFPPVALFPFQAYFSPEVFKCYIYYFAFFFMDISSSIQPMLYLFKEPPACCCKCCITKETDSINTAEPSTLFSVTG